VLCQVAHAGFYRLHGCILAHTNRAESEAAKGGEALVNQAREREAAMAQQVGG
jgi:hypothetical protein